MEGRRLNQSMSNYAQPLSTSPNPPRRSYVTQMSGNVITTPSAINDAIQQLQGK